jgi:dephospho-CoA kinase
MPAIAVTGGIACGKSTLAQHLVQSLRGRRAQVSHFSADDCAHELLLKDKTVRKALLDCFGTGILRPDQTVSRQALREIITEDPQKRTDLERILHPAIRKKWSLDAQNAKSSSEYFIAEIPLLYETNAAPFFNRIIAVSCSQASQYSRLTNRSWSPDQIREIVIAQAPVESKVLSAHYVIWTDVPMHIVGRQTALLAESLLQTFAE